MNRHVHCIYSDDIRHEIGGKVSFIGVYGNQMLVPELPSIIPKLCITIKAIAPADDAFKSLRVVVYQDDVVLAEAVAAEDQISMFPQPDWDRNVNDSIIVQTCAFNFVFTPLVLEKPCALRVRVYEEGKEELRGQGLIVDLLPPEMMNEALGQQ